MNFAAVKSVYCEFEVLVKAIKFTNIIQNNTRILHSLKFSNSNLLLFLEALHIKFKKPELNSGLKASKELVVFP